MPSKPHIIAVIPARYGSQRLPAKPLIDLLGKSLVQRVYEQAQQARLLDRIVVATDDGRIEKAVKAFGGEVVLTSPEIRSGSDRVAAVAKEMKGDIFVNIQGDEPLIAPEMIDQAVQTLLNDSSAVVGTLAKKIDDLHELLNPGIVKVVLDKHRHALYFSRSAIPHVRDDEDQLKWLGRATFLKHIGIYVFRRTFLAVFAGLQESALERAEKLEQLRILEAGETIAVGLTTLDSIPVDTANDVNRVLKILKSSSQPLPVKESP
ncbi:MAG: 3-deoxy-manno-octulosonate cytidylyltransferase [Ignavibacteriales bacterium]|nr:3-deoxy-manno-octulosonate cytidylyltransferase [Ignavibacteriales bacterium]